MAFSWLKVLTTNFTITSWPYLGPLLIIVKTFAKFQLQLYSEPRLLSSSLQPSLLEHSAAASQATSGGAQIIQNTQNTSLHPSISEKMSSTRGRG